MDAQFSTPGDLPEAANIPGLVDAWREYLDIQFQLEIRYVRDLFELSGVEAAVSRDRVQFRNPVPAYRGGEAEPIPPGQLHAISWGGFPRSLAVRERDGELVALLTAEQLATTRTMLFTAGGDGFEVPYRQGDEYCEWRPEWEGDRLRSVTFTCEAPDYFSAMAQGHPAPFFRLPSDQQPEYTTPSYGDPDWVLHLYRQLVDERVKVDDLRFGEPLYDRPAGEPGRTLMFDKGDYNPWNRWNTEHGIVHLTHPANTLGEQIELIGDATVLRAARSGRLIQAARCLLCCGGFGDVNRNSDPAIGAAVNELARKGLELTLANPVGLYMSHLQDTGWTTPDGRPASAEWWRVVRGTAGDPGRPGASTAVRAVYEIPEEERYTDGDGRQRPLLVGDLRIGGRRIEHAGQVADAVKMVMAVEAWNVDADRPRSGIGCQPDLRCCTRDGAERVQVEYAGRGCRRGPDCNVPTRRPTRRSPTRWCRRAPAAPGRCGSAGPAAPEPPVTPMSWEGDLVAQLNEPELVIDQIQADVLLGFRTDAEVVLAFRITQAGAARDWLRSSRTRLPPRRRCSTPTRTDRWRGDRGGTSACPTPACGC